MNKNIYLYVLMMFLISSCSNMSKVNWSKRRIQKFVQNEEAGEFIYKRTSGVGKDKKFITKSSLYSPVNEKDEYKKLITISELSKKGKDINFLLPIESEVHYFLDGKKYRETCDKYWDIWGGILNDVGLKKF